MRRFLFNIRGTNWKADKLMCASKTATSWNFKQIDQDIDFRKLVYRNFNRSRYLELTKFISLTTTSHNGNAAINDRIHQYVFNVYNTFFLMEMFLWFQSLCFCCKIYFKKIFLPWKHKYSVLSFTWSKNEWLYISWYCLVKSYVFVYMRLRKIHAMLLVKTF